MSAVAAWVDPEDLADMGEHGVCLDLYPNQIGDAYVPLYRTPPATIPVEALEELVRNWKQFAAKRCGADPVADEQRHGLDIAADELTQLIKERSNG